MASRALHVADTWAALQDPRGPFPGRFTPDGTLYQFPTVSTRNSRGKLLHWTVGVSLLDPQGRRVAFARPDLLGQPAPPLPGFVGVLETAAWQEGGEPRRGGVPTRVASGKNLGKKNATNPATQALRDALGLYNKQRLRGSAGALPASVDAPPASVGAPPAVPAAPAPPERPHPMLVKKRGETADARLSAETFRAGVDVQRKYNGQRMVAFADAAGRVVLYSRTGRDFPGMPRLRAQAGRLLAQAPTAWAVLCGELKRNPWEDLRDGPGAAVCEASPGAPAVYLDGELYKHGWSLNQISGEARRSDGGSALEFWVFDCFFPELAANGVPVTSATRQAFLDILFDLAAGDKAQGADEGAPIVRRVENFPAASDDEVDALAKRFVAEGYEGAIVRKRAAPYRYGTNGYHSANLVKVKPLHDAEFPVVGYTQGTRGKDVGAVIWIAEVPAGQSRSGRPERFSVVPKNMDYETRYEIFRRLEARPGYFEREFQGLPLTVEYPELSAKTGIPTQAKALGFRTYEPVPGAPERPDPVAALLAAQ